MQVVSKHSVHAHYRNVGDDFYLVTGVYFVFFPEHSNMARNTQCFIIVFCQHWILKLIVRTYVLQDYRIVSPQNVVMFAVHNLYVVIYSCMGEIIYAFVINLLMVHKICLHLSMIAFNLLQMMLSD